MKKLRFLIVDDAIFMRNVLKRIIEEKEGYEVVGEAQDGYDGIEKAKVLKPDIVTMDITMPRLSGIEAVKEVLKVSPDSKVIMVSAMGQKGMVIDAIKNGAHDFIIKPFEKSRVMEAIRNVMAR